VRSNRNDRDHQDQRDRQRLSPEESRSKVARVEGWEPFDQIDRSELDDH
jgi:hypothetical protein